MTESTAEAVEEATHHTEFVIIVNAEQHSTESKDVSYEQVVKLAYPTPPSPHGRFKIMK